MKKSKVLIVGVIGLLMTIGLVLACEPVKQCPGNGECTVTIEQGSSGMFIDDESPRSTCGKNSTWNSERQKWEDGCKVQDNIDNRDRKYGKHSCNC
jgi:hypothetical protein